MTVRILCGDALSMLRTLESESVQCVVTSPPYLGLRAYGTEPQVWGGDPEHAHDFEVVPSPGSRSSDTKPGPMQHPGNMGRERLVGGLCSCGAWRGELGLEPTPALFIEHLVAIFRGVRRVLRPDGLVFCNLGDSYHNARTGGMPGQTVHGGEQRSKPTDQASHRRPMPGIPQKSLMLIPERFAIAMQDDGWIVRSQIVWAKASCMPESVKDRPTSAWEPVWMFAKSRTYFYDADAVREPLKQPDVRVPQGFGGHKRNGGTTYSGNPYDASQLGGANLRNVWTLSPEPSHLEHYAGFPTELPKRCILAGSRPGDTVLDPFLGSGTTALVADRLGRNAVGIELNTDYCRMAQRRIESDERLFSEPVTVEAAAEPTQGRLLEAM